jgi:hypothetical protein
MGYGSILQGASNPLTQAGLAGYGGGAKVSTVSRAGKGIVEFMEPHVSQDSIWYVEKSNSAGTLWRCDGCGLVWTRRYQAEGCEKRGHVSTYHDGPYGVRYYMNGKPIGDIHYYPRYAVRRDSGDAVRRDKPEVTGK